MKNFVLKHRWRFLTLPVFGTWFFFVNAMNVTSYKNHLGAELFGAFPNMRSWSAALLFFCCFACWVCSLLGIVAELAYWFKRAKEKQLRRNDCYLGIISGVVILLNIGAWIVLVWSRLFDIAVLFASSLAYLLQVLVECFNAPV